MAKRSDSLIQRLTRRGWDNTPGGCWRVRGTPHPNGYVFMRFGGERTGAHRWAYRAWVGPIPEGHVVRHKCDNPPCVNPEHLETGTNADNSNDMVERGRSQRGAVNSQARVAGADVIAIRNDYVRGLLTMQMIADTYGVDRANIGYIVRGDTWTHVGGPTSKTNKIGL